MSIIPTGRYQAVCRRQRLEDGNKVWAQWGESAEKEDGTKTVQLLLYFEILDDVEGRGQWLPWFASFTAKSCERSMQSLRFMGWKGDDLYGIEEENLDQIVEIEVEHKQSQDGMKTYPQVAWVNQPGGGRIQMKRPMNDQQKRQFAARMMQAARGIAAVSGEKASSKKPAGQAPPSDPRDGYAPPPRNDDDIPF